MALSGEEDVGTRAQLPPSKCVKQNLISRETLGYFITLDLTQIFEQTFHQTAHYTATCLVFYCRLAYQSRASKHKN